jgi:hypothetical protein
MANQVLRFSLDLTNIESADDGETTHFGGTYTLNGEVRRGYGDDRSGNHLEDIKESIEKAIQANWPDYVDAHFAMYDAVENGVNGVENETNGVGTIVVKMKRNGTLLVTNE